MPNTKTSDEVDGTPAQGADQIRIARAGSNFRISVDDVNDYVQALVPPPSPTTPAGSDGDIQYNLTGAFSANTKLNWDVASNTLRLGEPSGHTIITGFDGINGLESGCSLEIRSGTPFNSGAAAQSGDIDIYTNAGVNGGNGGSINISPGDSSSGTPGFVTLDAGSQTGTGGGASVSINASPAVGAGNINGTVVTNTPLVISPSGNSMYWPPANSSFIALPNAGLWKSVKVVPGSAAAATSYGTTGATFQGTIAHPGLSGTNFATRTPSFTAAGTAVKGNSGGARGSLASFHRNVGIRFEAIFNHNVNTTGYTFFSGLYNVATALAGDPSALTNMVGMGYDAADLNTGNWQLMHNDNAGTATRIDLGASFARNTTTALRLVLNLYPSTTNVDYHIRDMVSGVAINGTLTTNLPVSNTFMNWQITGYNGAIAAAAQPRIWIGSIDGPMS